MTNLQGASKDLPPGQRERLSEGDVMYCVYWAHLKHNKDCTYGYVGITKDFEERKRAHLKNNKKGPFVSALSKYKNQIVWEVLCEGLSLEGALVVENTLRPRPNMGWNLQIGGNLGVESSWYDDEENREKHSKATSEGTKKGIADKDSTEQRSQRAKESWKNNRDSYKDLAKGSKNPKAKLTEEQVKEIKYTLIPEGMSNKEIGFMFSVKPYVISFIRTGKNWKHV